MYLRFIFEVHCFCIVIDLVYQASYKDVLIKRLVLSTDFPCSQEKKYCWYHFKLSSHQKDITKLLCYEVYRVCDK